VKLSIVTTLYRSAGNIDEFYRRCMAEAETIFDDVELVMVNDGSPDDSVERAIALHQIDPRVVVVDLSRNFGHHKAMMTGLGHATGDLIFLIDSDLEEAPELLSQFHQRLVAEKCDVVYGVQKARRGGVVERLTGRLYFMMLEALSDQPVPRNLVTARLMTRQYVRVLVRHRDREFLISHLWQISGFRQVPMLIEKLTLSPTNYSLRYRIEIGVKHVTTTSTKLLYMVLYFGLSISVLSVLTIIYYLGRYVTSGIGVDGFTSLIVSVWFFGGWITLVLGVLGIYIANIAAESKRRPYTVVRRVHRTRATPTLAAVESAPPDSKLRAGERQ